MTTQFANVYGGALYSLACEEGLEAVIGEELAKYLLDIWLGCDFAGGGSAPKVARINEIDKMYSK